MFRLLFTILFAATLLYAQPQQTWVDSIYAQMTLEQKIGQLFMVMAYPDGNASKRMATSKQIQAQHIGGVLFSKGTSKQQVLDTRTYQNQASIPLLIGADAEWGMAMRLTDVPAYPYAMTLGALPHSDLVYALGKRIGARKRSMGVHVTFSPVLDVNSESKNPIIGVRSFGDDPNNVAKKGLAFMEGLQQAGVWAIAKHFPGHGAAVQDSHKTLPRINRSNKALDSIDLFPFQQLITNTLKGVMVGHLAVPALTKNDSIPVSTSFEVVSDLLQHQMGFKGLIFTDALNMKGVTNRVAQPALQAFLAGVDILLVPENLTRSIANLKSHYLSGSITPERLAKSVKKILAAKYQLALEQTRKGFYEVLPFTSFDRYLTKQIAEQSLVLVHHNKMFPIAPKTPLAFVALGTQTDNAFLNALRQYTTVRQFSPYAAGRIRPNENLVVSIYADTATPWKKQLLSEDALTILAKLSKHQNVHVVVFAKPYVLGQLTAINEYASVLLAHQQALAFVNAAAQVLFAKSEVVGKLPVSLEAFD